MWSWEGNPAAQWRRLLQELSGQETLSWREAASVAPEERWAGTLYPCTPPLASYGRYCEITDESEIISGQIYVASRLRVCSKDSLPRSMNTSMKPHCGSILHAKARPPWRQHLSLCLLCSTPAERPSANHDLGHSSEAGLWFFTPNYIKLLFLLGFEAWHVGLFWHCAQSQGRWTSLQSQSQDWRTERRSWEHLCCNFWDHRCSFAWTSADQVPLECNGLKLIFEGSLVSAPEVWRIESEGESNLLKTSIMAGALAGWHCLWKGPYPLTPHYLYLDNHIDSSWLQTYFAGDWQNIYIPFSEFVGVTRAKFDPSAPPLNPGKIRQIGFRLSRFDFNNLANPSYRPGPFRLEVMFCFFNLCWNAS